MVRNRRLVWLCSLHLLVDVPAVYLATLRIRPIVLGLNELVFLPLESLILAQACLLGLWVVFSAVSRWKRILALVGAIILFECMLAMAIGDEEWIVPIAASLIMIAFAGLARWVGVRLVRLEAPGPESANQSVRFTIRGLMLATVGLALVFAGAKAMRQNSGKTPLAVEDVIWSGCFAAQTLVATWAIMGSKRPVSNGMAVGIASLLVGALLAFTNSYDWWDLYVYIPCLALLHAGITIGSLWVVRSCGYRLARNQT